MEILKKSEIIKNITPAILFLRLPEVTSPILLPFLCHMTNEQGQVLNFTIVLQPGEVAHACNPASNEYRKLWAHVI